MAYTKPVIVAQNSAAGSFAAGCPAQKGFESEAWCRECERTR